MLKKMYHERPKDWDKYINSLLFAYREVPQESTGFSPFELLYGRSVRGPMTIHKELWTHEVPDPEVKTAYQYIFDLKESLERTCELARGNLAKSSARYRVAYNKKARDRQFKSGDKVLILLPLSTNRMLMQWKGPYVITEKVGPLDYCVDTKGKLKTFHINMFRHYVEREDKQTYENDALAEASVAIIDIEQSEDCEQPDSDAMPFLACQVICRQRQ